MKNFYQAHDMIGASKLGETNTDKLTAENFALVAMQCYHHQMKPNPLNKNKEDPGSNKILSEAVKRTLKKLHPKKFSIANALSPSTLGKGSYISLEQLNYQSADKYCKSPEFRNRFNEETGISFDRFQRELLDELRKTHLYHKLQFKEIPPIPSLDKR